MAGRTMADRDDFDGAWIIYRDDGNPVDGDLINWYRAGTGAEPEWDQVDSYDHLDPTQYIAVRVTVTDVRHRTFEDGTVHDEGDDGP